MNLTDKQKEDIITEFNSFKDKMYAGKSKKEREELGQFFTPADMTIQMLEQLECTFEEFLDSDIIDPTSGSGNLLAAALILGVDSQRVFGNEYDYTMVALCRDRLNQVCDMLGKPHIQDWQIHQGNALIPDCLTEFGPEYDDTILKTIFDNNWIDNPDGYLKYKENQARYGKEHADKLEEANNIEDESYDLFGGTN